jgi:hypothetical protein
VEHLEGKPKVDALIEGHQYIKEQWGCKHEFGVYKWGEGFDQDYLV